MPRFKVLITDYAWPDVEIERRTLAEVEAELIVAPKEKQDGRVWQPWRRSTRWRRS